MRGTIIGFLYFPILFSLLSRFTFGPDHKDITDCQSTKASSLVESRNFSGGYWSEAAAKINGISFSSFRFDLL